VSADSDRSWPQRRVVEPTRSTWSSSRNEQRAELAHRILVRRTSADVSVSAHDSGDPNRSRDSRLLLFCKPTRPGKTGGCEVEDASCTAPPAVVSPGSSGTGHPAERKLATLLHPCTIDPRVLMSLRSRHDVRCEKMLSRQPSFFPVSLSHYRQPRFFPVSSCLRISAAAAEFRSTSCRGGGSCFRLTRLEATRMSRVSTTSASATLTVATIVLAATWVSDFIALRACELRPLLRRSRGRHLTVSA
jgi:hypothetical protein